VVDRDFPNENQDNVVKLAARKAAFASNGKLASELCEAAGIKVADSAPPNGLVPHQPIASNSTRKDDLVPNQVISRSEVLRQGTEAMARLSSDRSRDWADWLKVLAALGIGRHAAMLEANANQPRGHGYCTAFGKWLRDHAAFQAIDQADRKRMFDCLDNLGAIEDWRAKLSPAQLIKWNYPPTVLREWKKSRRPASPPDSRTPPKPSTTSSKPPAPCLLEPLELRRQLELLGPARFRQEVMPPDWRTPLLDTALSFASPDQLIAMLERKCSPAKDARAVFKSLKKLQRPNP
jgi:hypothetical protein